MMRIFDTFHLVSLAELVFSLLFCLIAFWVFSLDRRSLFGLLFLVGCISSCLTSIAFLVLNYFQLVTPNSILWYGSMILSSVSQLLRVLGMASVVWCFICKSRAPK